MTTPAVTPFDFSLALPNGRVLLDASAGTGKTYTLSGLVLRELAAGTVTADRLLVVTFTVAAASELRERIRGVVTDGLAELAATTRPDPSHPALAGVWAGGPKAVARSRRLLQDALAELEAASLTTIDGFAQQALTLLGSLADHDPAAQLVTDDRELLGRILRNVLVGADLDAATATGLQEAKLLLAATRLLDDPTARASDHDPLLAGLVVRAADEVRAARAAVRRTTFQDVLLRLAHTLTDPGTAAAARRVLQERFRLVLVDESQDTNPIQWRVLDAAFPSPTRVVVVGDAKQSIYAFRGADVANHLAARAAAADVWSLGTNHRADAGLVAGLQRLWAPASFGGADITLTPVAPSPEKPVRGLHGDDGAAVELRVFPTFVDNKQPKVGVVEAAVLAELAHEVQRLLTPGVMTVDVDDRDEPRPLRADDLAVLVRTNAHARHVHGALCAAGVDAMIDGVGSVLETAAAGWWRLMLAALDRPGDDSRARWASLTPLYGLGHPDLAVDDRQLGAAHDPTAVDLLHDDLHTWAEVLRDEGVAALLRRMDADRHVAARLLARPEGRRELVDVQHVADALHEAQRLGRLGVAGLHAWLVAAMDGTTAEDLEARTELERRLETDRPVVRISTVHRAKGLQYPIVFLPYAWNVGTLRAGPVTSVDADGTVVHITSDDPGWAAAEAAAKARLEDEWWRTTYVAMTRAERRVVAWWAPQTNHVKAPLSHLLFGTTPKGTAAVPPKSTDLFGAIDPRLAPSDAELTVRAMDLDVVPPAPLDATNDAAAPARVAAARTRVPDPRWRRTSYSGLVRSLPRPEGVAPPEHRAPLVDDEETTPVATPAAAGGGPDTPLPLAGLRGGREFGTFVHEVLEDVDFTHSGLADELQRLVGRRLSRRTFRTDTTQLVVGLGAALATPLGPIADGRALTSFSRADRLDELQVDLPLAGGWQPTGTIHLRAIADVLSHHGPGDPLVRRYAERLHAAGPRGHVRGYLNGHVDLVLRLRRDAAAGGPDRFLVVDHKTNRLGGPDGPVLADHHPDALADVMIAHDYLLQALLYTVALHRFLRWRLGGDVYDPAVHLAGVAYTFLRGMVGHDAPVTADGRAYGVFAWRPSAALVLELDDLLHTGDDEERS